MKPENNFPLHRHVRSRAAGCGLMALAMCGAMLGTTAIAESEMYHPATNTYGGVVAASTITSISTAGSNTTVCWYGMQGWYGVEMSTNAGTSWDLLTRVPASDHAWCATVNNGGNGSASFRLNQLNGYVGSGGCAGCHGDKFAEWSGTAHASAYSAIANMPPAVRQNCIVCHTVGQGQPSGFVDTTATPHLKDVGCENCHGPAAWHKFSDHDLIRPAVSIDPKICGGCHQDVHHPTFEEWEETPHSEVLDDINYGFANGKYFTNLIYVIWATNSVPFGTPGSSNCYGFYVTTNANLTLKTNFTTGIIHSGNGPGTPYVYDPGQDRAVSCGICHSAAARLTMLKDYEARLNGITNVLNMPPAHDAGEWTAACVTCHDPHSAEHPGQLRSPKWSTNYYTMPTTSDKRTVYTTNFMGGIKTNVVFYSAAFANMYNPNVNVCGQCHNSRGARWDGRSYGFYLLSNNASVTTNGPGIVYGVQTNISYSRPPHHSPQYNILSGNIQPDYLSGVYGTNFIGCHTLNTNGCAACHMAKKTVASPTPQDPNYTGHEFEPLVPAFVGCSVAGCHDGVTTTVDPTNGLATLQLEITNQITQVLGMLTNWAYLKGTNVFGGANAFKYKQNGWEYTTPGDLSSASIAGPSASDQLKIPEAVRQARFNLYNVSYGKSLGIHNPAYSRFLLNDASNKVWQASQ